MIAQLQAAGVSYGGRTVLDGLDLTISAGQQWALTGRSGSGKTTLLLLLAGLLDPTTGERSLALDRRDVVYVPQAPSLVPELTALENASLGLRVRGIPAAEAARRATVQLRGLGLDDVDGSFPDELSGGMQQRVSLAGALAIEARLMLADEPTGALDTGTSGLVLDVLRRQILRTAGSLVLATHDPDIARLFDLQVVLDKELVR